MYHIYIHKRPYLLHFYTSYLCYSIDTYKKMAGKVDEKIPEKPLHQYDDRKSKYY